MSSVWRGVKEENGGEIREDVGGVAFFAVDEGFGLGVAVGGDGASTVD